ncbi:hypothetical protein HX001_14220 [Empedobacter brevis]|uniref:Uncharacterized protein n=1 Tax=Empedobacter brevis TaxID=247 RepID=A0AAJ1V8K5_9FLAO|nr:hypothetical protein [Empedobacter brevis]MDM1073641.1 hypothetical protein [Empedobacter brevis]
MNEYFSDPLTYINFLQSIIVGIITGVGASVAFLKFYIPTLKPKIEISESICKRKGDDGKIEYLFKFVNKSNVEIFDVTVEPAFFKEFGASDGRHKKRSKIYLKTNKITFIPKEDKHDNLNSHAIIVKTNHDLSSKWKDESSYIHITIMCRHSLSGFNKVFHKTFNSKDCIQEGMFCSGNSLNYIPKKII